MNSPSAAIAGSNSYLKMVDNLLIFCKHGAQCPEAFSIGKKGMGESAIDVVNRNDLFTQLFLRAKHHCWGGRNKYYEKIKANITKNKELLENAPRDAFVEKDGSYTDLSIKIQQYNSRFIAVEKAKNPLYRQLGVQTITPKNCTELTPVKVGEVTTEIFPGIPADQQPHEHYEGWWSLTKIYHYNHHDIHVNHVSEAARIFLSTQIERIASLFGRMVEAVAGFGGYSVEFFKKFHYFRNSEHQGGEIYANDSPIATHTNQATSYWIGHASCLLNTVHKADNGETIKVNIITDPVEGDLNSILYPRMTREGRPIEKCPAPHIYFLSHNHLDHYSEKTILKLKHYQPIMIVPEGDAKKFRKMGFVNIYENNWWATIKIPVEQGNKKAEVKITTVPSRHWSGQGLCDGHHAAFLGMIVHQEEGDIYFAGDTARLSEEHIKTLRERFNVRSMLQPGGPDEAREDMQSTHQSSADGLWMHFNLMVRGLYDKKIVVPSKQDFLTEAKKLRTVYMHTDTFKLGQLHYGDTKESIQRIKTALRDETQIEQLASHEKTVYDEILSISNDFTFLEEDKLTREELLEILDTTSVIVPKIGSRTRLAQGSANDESVVHLTT